MGSRFLDEHPDWLEVWYGRLCEYDLGDLAGVGFAVSSRDDLTAFTPALKVPGSINTGVDDQAVPYESERDWQEEFPARL